MMLEKGKDIDLYCIEIDESDWLFADQTRKQREANIVSVRDSSVDPKINRNDLCPCGSGLKYKKCCGK